MQTVYTGVVGRGFQFASGHAAGRPDFRYPMGTLKMQEALFKKQRIDLEALVPGLFWGTVNLEISRKLILKAGDHIARDVDWTASLPEEDRIDPETFSFVHCCFAYPAPAPGRGIRYYPGLLYYPHPETKPKTNRHNFDVLEVLTEKVPGLVYGTLAAVICRADAFEEF